MNVNSPSSVSSSASSVARRVSYNDDEALDLKRSMPQNAVFDDFASVYSSPQSAKKRKSVVFNEQTIVYPILKVSSTMSVAQRNELYYTQDDTDRFKLEVNQVRGMVISRARHLASMVNPKMTVLQHATAMVAADSDLRSLGKYICPARNINKQTVMVAVRKYKGNLFKSSLPVEKRDDCLAEAYSKLSNWAKMNAIETARADFLQNYEEDGAVVPATKRIRTEIEAKKPAACNYHSKVLSSKTETNEDTTGAQPSIKDKLLAVVESKSFQVNPLPKLTKKRKRTDC